LANAVAIGSGRENGDIVDLQSVIVAIVGAVLVVWVVGLFSRRTA